MTRLTDVLQKMSARNQNKNVKKMTGYVKNSYNTRVATTQFLRESILETKAKTGTGGMCLGDMQVYLDCLKLNEFQENTCIKEMIQHRECVKREKAMKAELSAKGMSDELGISGHVNKRQANKLLRMYPSPKPQLYLTHSNKAPMRKPIIMQYNADDPPYMPEDIYRKAKS